MNYTDSRMPFGCLWTNKSCGCLTLAQAASFKLGQQSPPLVKGSLFFICAQGEILQWANASTEPRVAIWEGKCSHWFAVEGGGRLIFVAPVTCHCFCHKQLPRWIRRERGRCITAESCLFFLQTVLGGRMQSAAKMSSHGIDLGNLRSWLMI